MIKFEMNYSDEIIEVEVVRETDKTVWVKSKGWHDEEVVNQRRKDSSYRPLFDSWEDAHNSIIVKTEKEIENYKYNLKRAEERLIKINSMVKS